MYVRVIELFKVPVVYGVPCMNMRILLYIFEGHTRFNFAAGEK